FRSSKSATAIASLVIPNDNENSYHTVLTALGQLWLKGIEPNCNTFYTDQSRQKVWLPAYVFDRKLCWSEAPIKEVNTTISQNTYIEPNNIQPIQNQMNTVIQPNRKSTILEKISNIILNTSGMEIDSSEYDRNFLELGLDSLVLTQMAITCKNEFNSPITFRQLNGEFSTPNLLANHLDKNLSPELFAPAPTNAPVSAPAQNSAPATFAPAQSNGATYSNNDSAMSLIAQQLQLLGKQIELLQGNNPNPVAAQPVVTSEVKPIMSTPPETLTEDEIKEHKKPFGASPKIEKQATELKSAQKDF